MRRLTSALLAGSALALIAAGPALAQSQFDGPYVGAFAGYSQGDVATGTGAAARDVKVDGYGVGAYAGYGVTFNSIYFGAEGELGYADKDGNRTVGTTAYRFDTGWSYGVAARAGFLVTPDILAYGKVGYQWTDYDITGTAGTTSVDLDRTFKGWRYGGGVEVAFAQGLTTRFEYNYTDYKGFTPVSIGGTLARLQPDDHTIRVGLGYRF